MKQDREVPANGHERGLQHQCLSLSKSLSRSLKRRRRRARNQILFFSTLMKRPSI